MSEGYLDILQNIFLGIVYLAMLLIWVGWERIRIILLETFRHPLTKTQIEIHDQKHMTVKHM